MALADTTSTQAERPTDWRAIDWSKHERRARIARADVNYVDFGEGDGPPVVFVHGLGGQWGNWLANLPVIGRARRVIAPDLPGFGGSDMPAQDVSISGYTQVVDELCEHLGLGPVVVVGNSMGGFIASDLALAHPERVEKLVLVGAAGMVPSRRERFKTVAILRLTGIVVARTAGATRAVAARPRLRRAALRTVAHDPDRIPADLAWRGLMGDPPPAFAPALKAAVDYLSWDWCQRLEEIRSPTLLVWGEQDALIPVRHQEEFARRITGARSLTMPETGHVPMVERPAEFNRALLEFLGEHAAAAQR